MTHYETAGPPAGPAVVLVHGFSTPLLIWERTSPALAGAGFHAVAYDLFGRGWSDRLRCAYGPPLYERQLLGLLETLGPRWPVDLVGFSMGAQICADFADRHPARVRRVVLIDPAGFSPSTLRPSRLALLPLAGEYLQWRIGPERLAERALEMFADPATAPPDFRVRVMAQARFQGTGRALLSTRRSMPGEDRALYRRLGASGKRVLIVWGREDRMTPFAQHELARRAMPGAEFVAVDGAGHAPHYERPDVVNRVVVEFLRRG
ncbi:MAG: alpha/beta fold hydrolase [Gemmatimonadales bacterium]